MPAFKILTSIIAMAMLALYLSNLFENLNDPVYQMRVRVAWMMPDPNQELVCFPTYVPIPARFLYRLELSLTTIWSMLDLKGFYLYLFGGYTPKILTPVTNYNWKGASHKDYLTAHRKAVSYCRSWDSEPNQPKLNQCGCGALPLDDTLSKRYYTHAWLIYGALSLSATWPLTLMAIMLSALLASHSLYHHLMNNYAQLSVRSAFSGTRLSVSNLRRDTAVARKSFVETIPVSEQSEHPKTAHDRDVAINAGAAALTLNWQGRMAQTGAPNKIFDVCGVPSRYHKSLQNYVTCIIPRDISNANALDHTSTRFVDHLSVAPRDEIKGYNAPVLMSLCDWHYTMEELVTIFSNHGGLIVTHQFVTGKSQTIYDTESSYFATAAGVVQSVSGGPVYSHGYHQWRDGSILIGNRGLLRVNHVGNVGHLTLFAISPFSSDTPITGDSPSILQSVSIRRNADHEGLIHHEGVYFAANSSKPTPLDLKIVQLLSQNVENGHKTLQRLAMLHLANVKDHMCLLETYVDAAYHLAATSAHADACSLRRIVSRFALKWCLPYVQMPFNALARTVRRTFFTHAVYIADLPEQSEGRMFVIAPTTSKPLYQIARSAALPAVDNGTQPLSNNGGRGRGGDEHSGKPAMPRHPAPRSPRAETDRPVSGPDVATLDPTIRTANDNQGEVSQPGGTPPPTPPNGPAVLQLDSKVPDPTPEAVKASSSGQSTATIAVGKPEKDQDQGVRKGGAGRQKWAPKHQSAPGRSDGPSRPAGGRGRGSSR